MLRKIITYIVVAVIIAGVGVFGFFADELFKKYHDCEFAQEYSYNETHHWFKCTEELCDEVKDYATHTDENADKICDVCNYDGNVYIQVITIDELKEAIATNAADIIVLNADLDLKDVNDNKKLLIDSGKHILDLNGHTIKGVDDGSANWHAIDVRGSETELTIIDSSDNQTGTIEGRCYGIQVSRGAKLTIEGGNFTCTQNGTYNQSVVVYGGTLIINGGKFTSRVYESIYGQAYTWDEHLYENTIIINDGEFNYIGETEVYGIMYFSGENQTVVINGGVFNKGAMEYVVYIEGNTNYSNNANVIDNLD